MRQVTDCNITSVCLSLWSLVRMQYRYTSYGWSKLTIYRNHSVVMRRMTSHVVP